MDADPQFWGACPQRRLAWEEDAQGRAVLLRPKLGDHRLGHWIASRLQDPYYRIRLDEMGTLVWKACDGRTRLADVVARMRQNFGEQVEPAEERLHKFILHMYRSKLIQF